MAKRIKRAEKNIESIEKEIENHFKKLEKDISENNLERGRYHYKELNFGFLPALENKLKIADKTNEKLLDYKKRLELLKEKVNL